MRGCIRSPFLCVFSRTLRGKLSEVLLLSKITGEELDFSRSQATARDIELSSRVGYYVSHFGNMPEPQIKQERGN